MTGDADLEMLLRRVIREETGISPVAPADRWRGGSLVLRPGTPGLQEKSWPIETFFHKVVMLRNRLRTLEQQVNAADLPDDAKVKLQSYITGCYGSLTSFNVLFADEDDQFKGRRRLVNTETLEIPTLSRSSPSQTTGTRVRRATPRTGELLRSFLCASVPRWLSCKATWQHRVHALGRIDRLRDAQISANEHSI